MTPAADTAAVLRTAVADHRAGRLAEARRGYDRVLTEEPGNAWANYFRAVVADAEGDAALALACLRRAAAAPDRPVQSLVMLGNRELGAGHPNPALAAFDAALASRPRHPAAAIGRALALKRLDRLAEAAEAARHAVALRRGWQGGAADPPGDLDPAERAEMRRTNRVKLAHDAAQIRHLVDRGMLGPEAAAIAAGCDRLLAELGTLPDDTSVVALDERALAATCHAYNRLLHLPPGRAPAEGMLSGATDFAAADRAFARQRPLPVVIDGVLSPAALTALQRYCREATIWFEVKDHGGHLGAYFEEGLASELTVGIAEALRRALPGALGGLGLAQMWAYKHVQGGAGTDLHADIGSVSANLWITADDASLDAEGGGLEIWPVRMPEGWDFHRANIERDGIRSLLAERRAAPVAIAHRCNRLVLFEANLFHRTSPGRFRPGYENRRVNITFLYDRMPAAASNEPS